ncbi:hypothetical protein D3C84_980230 [compost metagenome]
MHLYRLLVDDDILDGLLNAALNAAYEREYFLGRGGRFFCQLANFLSDNGEAFAMLASTGCLNGSVQRQQVRLFCNFGDRVSNLRNAGCVASELADRLRHFGSRFGVASHARLLIAYRLHALLDE